MKTFRNSLLILAALLLLPMLTSAQQAVAPNGRWEIAIISGDTPATLVWGQGTISMYLNVNSKTGAITQLSALTTDNLGVDTYCCNDTLSGNFNFKTNAVTLVYNQVAVPSVGNVAATYTFTGTYVDNGDQNPSTGPIIEGTYTDNAPTYNVGGKFVATWFPDFPAQSTLEYIGALSPDEGAGPEVPAIIFLGQDPSTHLLTGNITVDIKDSNGASCFVDPTLTIQESVPSQIESFGSAYSGYSYAAGVGEEFYATDSVGNWLWLIGYSAAPNGDSAAVGENYLCGQTFAEAEENNGNWTCTDTQSTQTPSPFEGLTFSNYTRSNDRNNGTNNSLIFWYLVGSGPCSGLGGSDAPFQLVVKKSNPNSNGNSNNSHKHQYHNHGGNNDKH